MRSASGAGTTVSASRKAPIAARVPTRPAYSGGQPDALDVGDLGHRQPLRVVQDHGGPVDDRQMHQGVLELLAGLGPADHDGRVHGVGVIPPLLLYLALDVFGGVFTVCAEPVDCEVVQDAVQPGGQRRLRPEGVGPLQGAQHRLLHEVLGQRSVRGDGAGVPQQAGDLASQAAANVRGGHDDEASARW
jgi:hypothetical protein